MRGCYLYSQHGTRRSRSVRPSMCVKSKHPRLRSGHMWYASQRGILGWSIRLSVSASRLKRRKQCSERRRLTSFTMPKLHRDYQPNNTLSIRFYVFTYQRLSTLNKMLSWYRTNSDTCFLRSNDVHTIRKLNE